MENQPIYRREKRNNRFNVNLTDTESEFFGLVSRMTGIPRAVVIREMAMKGALKFLSDNQYSTDTPSNKDVYQHLLRR